MEFESPMNLCSLKKAHSTRMEETALGLEDKMPFGKYKGYTFNRVGEFDSTYLIWFKENCKSVNLSKELSSIIDKESLRQMSLVKGKSKSFLDRVWEGEIGAALQDLREDLPF